MIPMNAAIYARYSSDQQREESIQAQLRACQEYANKHGFIIVRTYIDEARSGTNDNREQFQKMIEDSDNGIFSAVIVHKLDRFARNRFDSAIYRKRLKDNNIKLISVLEQFNDSPESILLESLVEGMAEYYSANLARETMKGLKENAYQCKFNGGRPPLGYDIDQSGKYIINAKEAIIIQKIFRMYADGYSYQDICNDLNRHGLRTRIGKPFSKNSLHDILSNERYRGIYIFNQAYKKSKRKLKDECDIIKIPGGIPAIIDDEIFERVRKRMKNQAAKRAQHKAKVNYLLTGLLYCGECGSAMVGNRRVRGDKVYASYECGGRKRKHDCNAKSITKEKIERQVLTELEQKILNPQAIDILTDMVVEYSEKNLQEIYSQVEALAKEMKEVQSQIDNIVNAIAAGMFHQSMKEKMDSLELRKSELMSFIQEAEIQKSKNTITREMVKKYIENDTHPLNRSEDEQKRIIQRYINRIDLYPDKAKVNFYVDINGCGTPITIVSTILF